MLMEYMSQTRIVMIGKKRWTIFMMRVMKMDPAKITMQKEIRRTVNDHHQWTLITAFY